MGRFVENDAAAAKTARLNNNAAFERMLDQYNDRLAEEYDTPEPAASVQAAPVQKALAPAVAPATPVQPAAPSVMHEPAMGGGVKATALQSDPVYSQLSYQGKRDLADASLEKAKATLTKAGTPAAAVSATIAAMRKEYEATLGPAPERGLLRSLYEPIQQIGVGAMEAAKSVTDLGGARNTASDTLRHEIEMADARRSDKTIDDEKYISELRAKMGPNPSVGDRLSLAGKQFAQNPLGSIARVVGGIAPIAAAAPLGVPGLLAAGTAMGAGSVKGGIYDAIKNAPEEQLLTDPAYVAIRKEWSEDTAREKFAVQQQEYMNNKAAIAIGAGVGGAATVLSPAARTLVAANASRGATAATIAAMAQADAQKVAARSLIRPTVIGGVEQTAVNAGQAYATADAVTGGVNAGGATTPSNALDAAVNGALPGLVVGSAFGAHGGKLNRANAKQAVAQYKALEVKAATEAEAAQTPAPVVDPAAPPKTQPTDAGPFAEQYAAMGVPAEEMQSKFGVKNADGTFTDTRLTDIDPTKFADLTGTPLSHTIEGATDQAPAAVANANQVDSTAPFADAPATLRPTAEAAAPAAATWHTPQGVDVPVTLSGVAHGEMVGTLKPDGTPGAFVPRAELSVADPTAGARPLTEPRPTPVEPKPPTPEAIAPVEDRPTGLVDSTGAEVTTKGLAETQQQAADLVAGLEKTLEPTKQTTRGRLSIVRTDPKIFNKSASSGLRSLSEPAGKKKVGDIGAPEGEVNDNARTSAEPQGREGQVAPVEGARNTEAVAGQEAGAAERVGVNLQKPAGAGREAEAGGGRSGAGTAGAEPSIDAGGKQSRARLGKPDKVDGRRRPAGEPDFEKTATREQAIAEWEDSDGFLQKGVTFDQLPARSQEAWSDAVAFGTQTLDQSLKLAQGAKSLTPSEKINTQKAAEDARNKQDFGRALTPQGEVDHPTVWAAAKTGSAEGVLEAVAKTDLTREQRQLVDKLRGTLSDVVVVPSEGSKSPSYNHQHKTVTLNNGSVESALHELGHAGTIGAIAEVQQGRGTPEQVSAVNELAKLQQVIEAEGKLANVSAFKPSSYEGVDPSQQNMVRAAEIVAEVNANSRAQRALARISGDGKSFNGVQRFVAAVRDLLGLQPSADSALAKVLRLTDPLIAKTEPGAKALVNSGFALGDLQRNIINKKSTETWPEYAHRKGLAFSESDWVVDHLSKRPDESWPQYIDRKFTAYKAAVERAERGFTVISSDGKHLKGFDNQPAAEAYQVQHPGSRIDTKVSMFSGDRSIDSFMERARNMVSARVLADGEKYVNPLKQKLKAYYESRPDMNPTEAHAELNDVAHALISVEANEVGRRLHTPLNALADAKRRSIDHDMVTGKISESTAWRMQKVLADNPANRALDDKGKPLPMRENFGGMSDAEAQAIIAKSKEATEFLTKTAKAELDAIRDRLKQLSVESEQFDERGAKRIKMYNQEHYFPLYGDDGGPLIDVGRGFGSTESGTLHQREGRSRKAYLPLDALVHDLEVGNQRIVERDQNHLLLRMFYAANNKNSDVHDLAKKWFEQAGIRYEKSDVLDATDQAKNANQATQGSSKTIIARERITNGQGKIKQVHFTVDDRTSNGQRGSSFIAAWSGNNIANAPGPIRLLSGMTRAYTSVMTRLNPTFAPADWYRTQKMVGSLLAGDFGLNVGTNFLSHMAETNPLAIGKAISGSPDANPKIVQYLREMMDMGALTANTGKYGLKGTTLELQGARRFGQKRETLAHTIDMYNEAFEWSPRVAAYITLREHGLSASDAGLWQLKVANFSMQGEWTPIIRAFVPFYNPGVQGMRRMADVVHQVAAGNHRMTGVLITRALTAAVMYGLMNSFAGKDENGVDKFAKMAGSKHYRNDYAPNPFGEGFIALPRPIDMGPVDGFGIAIARVMLGHSMPKQAVGEYAQEGLQRVSPVEVKDYHGISRNLQSMISGPFRPMFEVGYNENGLGVPISNDHEQNKKHAAFDGRETTPKVYKDVAAGLAGMGIERYSPEDVRHLFKSYGQWFAAGADALAVHMDKTQAPASNTAKLIPFAGRFMEPAPTSDSRVYDLAADAKDALKTINGLPNAETKEAFRTANPKVAASADLWKKLDADQKALGKEGKALNQPPVEKKAYMLEKRNRINDDFIRQYREINK